MREFDRHYLLKLRKVKGYSHEVLARMIGVRLGGTMTRASISHWEQGISKPSIDSLLALGEIFERPLDYFFVPYQNYLFVSSKPDKKGREKSPPPRDRAGKPRRNARAAGAPGRERPAVTRPTGADAAPSLAAGAVL